MVIGCCRTGRLLRISGQMNSSNHYLSIGKNKLITIIQYKSNHIFTLSAIFICIAYI